MLIRCPECDREVSDIAKSCPHCGFPISIIENGEPQNKTTDGVHYARPTKSLHTEQKESNGKKNAFWVVLVIVVLFLGGSCTDFYDSEEPEVLEDELDVYSESVLEETVVETTEEIQPEVAEMTMEEYISECQEYNYKDVLRNPSDFVGQKVKIVVKISSVHEATWLYNNKYYFANSEGEYGYFTGDRYAIIDKRYDNSLKLLDEDVILVYGEIAEPEETKSYIVNSQELFTIDMRYAELLDE